MQSFSRVFKYSLGLIPIGGLAYYYYPKTTEAEQPKEIRQVLEHSDYFQQYVNQHNLISPNLYKKFQEKYKFNHFFEKGVLKDLEGLDAYNLFLNKNYHDILINNIKFTHEEKQKVHEQAQMHCTFTPNVKLQGQAGQIHGGFTSTLFDNIAGCLAFMASDFAPAVTAYLNVSHQRPMNVGTEYIAVVEVDKVEGRKVFLKGKIVDKENNVYTNMDSLFIKPKWGAHLKHIYRHFLSDKNHPVEQLALHPKI